MINAAVARLNEWGYEVLKTSQFGSTYVFEFSTGMVDIHIDELNELYNRGGFVSLAYLIRKRVDQQLV